MKRQTVEGHIPGRKRCPIDMDPWMELCAAIVRKAADEYIDIMRNRWKQGLSVDKKHLLLKEKLELERFFYSRWFDCLCDISPEWLIRACISRAEEMEKEVIERKNKLIVKNWLKSSEHKFTRRNPL